MVKRSLSHRAVAWLSVLLLLVSILPLYAQALYNHSFYDDLGFSLLTRDAWRQTGSVFAVLEAAVRNTVGIRQTWEGTYSTSFISALQPAVFGEGAYWVTTFLLLTAFLLAVWYFLRQTLHGVYGMDGAGVAAAFGVLGFVLTQFVPDAAEAFYWFNGGVAYTLLWSVMLFTAGLWLRFERAQGKAQKVLLYLALVVLTAVVGGAKYSTVLFAALLAVLFTGWAFAHRRPKRFAYLSFTLVLLMGFAFSVTAPGNDVRAATLAGNIGAPKAVLETVYFGLALLGHGFSLPLLAALALLVPLCLPAVRQCSLRFAHPMWVTLLSVGLFCAQLAPTLYTGNYLGDGRVLNTYHYTMVLMLAQLTVYWTGYFVRRRERGLAPLLAEGEPTACDPALPQAAPALPDAAYTDVSDWPDAPPQADAPPSAQPRPRTALLRPAKAEERIKALTLLVVAGMLLAGVVAFHPDGSMSYGPQNTAGGSALRSVVSGEAAAYSQAMAARDAVLTDPSANDVTLAPIEGAPANFMGDALAGDNLEYVLRLYAEYYDKASVSLAGQGD
jgi:hypothetical protein